MGKAFYLFFRAEYHKMRSKFDLYFVYEILRKIMLIYKKDIGVYTGFFWGTMGVISQTYVKLHSMDEQLYGMATKERYRMLVETFLKQEGEKNGGRKFEINNHPTMAALTYKQNNKQRSHYNCYLLTPSLVTVHGVLNSFLVHRWSILQHLLTAASKVQR